MLLVRKVEEKDIQLLFDWANDPKTRLNSLNSNKIEWEEHLEWFKVKFNSPHTFFFIITNIYNEDVGFVRFEEKVKWYAGIVISPEMQGKGIGKEALRVSIIEFYKNIKMPIWAQIKKSNIGSIKIFEANYFSLVEDGEILLYKRDIN